MTLVIVDAENVRRSIWPNLPREELVARARAWAARTGHEVQIVFDGAAPEQAPDLLGAPHADDAIVELAERTADLFWVVTSDRGLREHLGDLPARLIGGGAFVRELVAA